jgi:hypothetical protein
MSEIRFQPSANFTPLSGSSFFRGPGGAPESEGDGGVALLGPPTSLSAGTVESLMGANAWAAPNVFEAAPLLSLQAHAACQITNPSTTPEHPEDGVDGRKCLKGTSSVNAVAKALTRATSRLGQGTRTAGSVLGLAGSALALPGNISEAVSSIDRAWRTGQRSDVAKAVGNTAAAGSTGSRLLKHGVETYSLGARALGHRLAGRAGEQAFRQVAPNASKAVLKSAGAQAAREAMKDAAEKVARRAVSTAATQAAKSGGTVARGAGAISRTVANRLLREGGEAAAKAAGKAVAKGALKSGAKAAGRFVPGLNVAIAAFDTASAAATLADPKASTGKKVTSCITAAGSIVAATNIPVVSQIGAAVSTVSSFIGSFF